MGWSDKFEVGDKVRVTVDFEDTVSHSCDEDIELIESSWAISADDPRVTVKKIKPLLPARVGSVIDIAGGGRAMLTTDGYWQFSDGGVYSSSQVRARFDYSVVLSGR